MNEADDKQESISKNLAITVSKGDLELPAQILEFTIDQIVDDGILKDIPFVGWIAKGLSVSQSISDRILFHKIIRFLFALEESNTDKKDRFRNKIIDDVTFEKKVGEHLLIVLNKIDAHDKASLVAKCFNHFLDDTIDHDYFVDLANIIERSTISDLKSLSVPRNKRVRFRSVGVAVSSGILVYGMCKNDDDEPDIGSRMSAHGEDLRHIFLGDNPEKYINEKANIAKRKELFG